MTKSWLVISFTILSLFGQALSLQAQNEEQEVFLQFRYQNVVNDYISSLYANEEFYLSVSEIFNSLHIDLNADHGRILLQGDYLGEGLYQINLNDRQASFQNKRINLTAEDFIISDLGYYLKPKIFKELLGLEFIIDFNNLAIHLETDDMMPVVAQRARERTRERLNRTRRELTRSFSPLQFDRDPNIFNGGFLDYNLTANFNPDGYSHYLFNSSIGTELLGGDFQGSVIGSYSQVSSALRTTGLRWRYGIRNSPWVSTVTAGQATSGGLSPAAYTGIKLTNEPIEPRYLYGETALTGSADPRSEVELYRNNTLVDFTDTDESGLYRFTVPLTYGSSQYYVRIYNRSGQMTQRNARVQIPFHFLPPGEVTYTLDAGRLDNPISGSTERGFISKAEMNAGLSSWLTATGGMEYFEDFHHELPTFYGSLSSRFLTNYLLTVEGANNAFYRARASVIYPSNASMSVDYTYYNQQGGLYNPERNQASIRANVFAPFSIGPVPFFFRSTITSNQRTDTRIFRYRADLNTRIGRMNIRAGYRDTQIGPLNFQSTPVSRLQVASSYSFSQSRNTLSLLRGVFLRAQMNYIPALSEIEDLELQFSRNIFRKGRLHLSAGHNFTGNYNLFRFTLALDFNKVRSNTSVRSSRQNSSITQTLRGSAGFDSNHRSILLSNRQQTGRSGVAVRLFVDNSNSGSYEPGDELIAENAVRLDRAGGTISSKNGITYISQLQPYRRYNMSIHKSAVNNPLLVPELQNFSIITDPNQYKLLEIPFYMSGVADGIIYQVNGENKSGLGGIRLYLTQVNTAEGTDPYTEEIRTFSDGSFYSYEIPPGDYELRVDPSQLDFLNVKPDPEFLSFTIHPLAEGDFVEKLEMNLIPDEQVQPEDAPKTRAIGSFQAPSGVNTLSMQFDIPVQSIDGQCDFSVQAGSFSTIGNAFKAVDEFSNNTKLDYEIYYHPKRKLYSVRTLDTGSLPEVLAQAKAIQSTIQNDVVAVVNQCSAETRESSSIDYQIQLASFSSEERARKYQLQLEDEYNLQSFLLVENNSLYRVRIGPYKNSKEVQRAYKDVKNRGISDDAYYTFDPELVWNNNFDLKLQLGRFEDDEQAMLYSLKFRSDYEMETSLLADYKYLNVMSEKRYKNWGEILEDYFRFAEDPRYESPTIHIIEK